MRYDIIEQKNIILEWIKQKKSKSFIAKKLNCKIDTLNIYLKKMGIEYNGNQGGRYTHKPKKNTWTLKEYLEKSIHIQPTKIRKKLLREGLKPYRCENCGLSTWLNGPIPLELHHIDGNKTHNTLENFQLLCPNCHALTNSYRGKNVKKNKKNNKK